VHLLFSKKKKLQIVFSMARRLWQTSIKSNIQSNHFGGMQFNLIFQTYLNNPKKQSAQTHVSQFKLTRVNIHSIQSRKYLFNPITEIFMQSKHRNIYFIHLLKYQLSCNPFHSHSYLIH